METTRGLWRAICENKALRVAAIRLTVAFGQVQFIGAPALNQDAGIELDGVSAHMGPMPVKVPFDDPFTVAKVVAAREICAAAFAKAEQAAGDERAARLLIWAWQRQNPELEIALARIWALGITPAVIVRYSLPQAGQLN